MISVKHRRIIDRAEVARKAARTIGLWNQSPYSSQLLGNSLAGSYARSRDGAIEVVDFFLEHLERDARRLGTRGER